MNPSATGGQPAMLSLFFVGAHTGWVFMLGATKASVLTTTGRAWPG